MTTPVPYGQAPGGLPLIGHAHRLMRDPLPFLASLSQHGSIVRIRLATTRAVVVCDPVLARTVLREDRIYDKGGPVIGRMREVLGNGLVSCPHQDHRRQRRLIQRVFRRDRMPGYTKIMLERITDLVTSWTDGQEVDAVTQMRELATNITVASMFANRVPAAQATRMIDDFAIMAAIGLVRSMVPNALLRLPLPANLRHERARVRVRRTFQDVITQARADGTDHGDLLSMLIARDAEQGDAFTDSEVVDQICTFFVAGMETTAGMLASALHVISHDTDLQQQLRAEADRVLATGPFDHSRLPELALTGRVITETLRLYPPGWMIARWVTTDTELGGHRIAAGTCAVVSPYQVHLRPDVYSAAEDFDPQRWQTADKSARDAFIPFGAGARKCIGDEFSLVEGTLALASVLARWHLEPVTGPSYDPSCNFALRPSTLRIRVTSRTDAPASTPPPSGDAHPRPSAPVG